MRLIVIYLFWGHYKSLECRSDREGLEILSDLATHEDMEPVGVYNPKTRRITWHPENPFRPLQETDPTLTRFLLKAQLSQLMSSYK
jgi:hypothetical protein